jgi:hypothetical protein
MSFNIFSLVNYAYFDEQVIDASAMGMIATPVRKKLVDLVYVIWTESFVMVVPVPGEEPRLFAFILPFQSTVCIPFSVS